MQKIWMAMKKAQEAASKPQASRENNSYPAESIKLRSQPISFPEDR